MTKFLPALLLILLPALPASAISLTAGGYTTDFSSKPSLLDFSTRTVAGAPADITTEADRQTQEIILKTLREHFPNDAFCAEESTPTAGDSPTTVSVATSMMLMVPDFSLATHANGAASACKPAASAAPAASAPIVKGSDFT